MTARYSGPPRNEEETRQAVEGLHSCNLRFSASSTEARVGSRGRAGRPIVASCPTPPTRPPSQKNPNHSAHIRNRLFASHLPGAGRLRGRAFGLGGRAFGPRGRAFGPRGRGWEPERRGGESPAPPRTGFRAPLGGFARAGDRPPGQALGTPHTAPGASDWVVWSRSGEGGAGTVERGR